MSSKFIENTRNNVKEAFNKKNIPNWKDQSAYNFTEKGTDANLRTLSKTAKALGVTMESFFYDPLYHEVLKDALKQKHEFSDEEAESFKEIVVLAYEICCEDRAKDDEEGCEIDVVGNVTNLIKYQKKFNK